MLFRSAYDKCEIPKYSLIYYKNDDFNGGELEFIDGLKIRSEERRVGKECER